MNKKYGKIIVKADFLAKVFNLPAGARVLEIRGAGDPHSTDFEIIVESDLLRNLRDGEAIPVVEPMTQKLKCGHLTSAEPGGWLKK